MSWAGLDALRLSPVWATVRSMSLTARLDDRDSSVSHFMAAELPGLKELQATYRAQRPAHAVALRPEPPAGIWPAWGTLGAAIDHRLPAASARP